jgi:hypothetical protein
MEKPCNDTSINLYCKSQFDTIKEDIKEIKEAIVGNGKVGYNVRIDRLERSQQNRSKLNWIIISCVIVILINSVWSLSMRVVQHSDETDNQLKKERTQ